MRVFTAMAINRGEIYFVSLFPPEGRVLGDRKPRPAVVLSINLINRNTPIAIVVPGTTKPSNYRNIVRVLPTADNGLTSDTYFFCHNIRAIDQRRFDAPPIGRMSAKELQEIENTVKFSIGIP